MPTLRQKAYASALVAVFLWSTMATAFKLGLREMSGLQLMLGASLVSVAMLLLISAAQGRLSLFRQVGRADLGRAALLGFLNPFAYYAVLLKAYSILPTQEAMALNYMWPAVLVLLSIPMLGQKVAGWEWIALLISFFGILVVGTQGQIAQLKFTHPLGDALALGSTVIWALYWNFNVRNPGDDIVKLVLNLAFGSVYLLVAVLLFSKLQMPTPRGWASIAYVGLFEMGITFFLWLKALRLSPSTAHVSQLIYLAPFLALFWIQLALKESVQPATFVGLSLVVGGTLMQQHMARTKGTRMFHR
jgi:drug/metabolite transporter (DMT)-like permease